MKKPTEKNAKFLLQVLVPQKHKNHLIDNRQVADIWLLKPTIQSEDVKGKSFLLWEIVRDDQTKKILDFKRFSGEITLQ